MSKIQLYIASSLDGFIAREHGELDWLDNLPNPDKSDYGYAKFYKEVSTVLMGRKTYKEILGFDVEYPYKNCKSYVFSSNQTYQVETQNTFLVNCLDKNFIRKIKKENQKNIWVVGGGKLIASLVSLGAIDEMILFIAPIILGKGIRLLSECPLETKLELCETQFFSNGMVKLMYRKAIK